MDEFYHKEDGKIEYHEVDGILWYSYREEEDIGDGYIYETKGKVPKKIISQGNEAIQKYVSRKVNKAIRSQKKSVEEHLAYANDPNFPVEVRHRGLTLKGKIIYASHRQLTVRLEEPYQGEHYVLYGWASAIHGRYIFDGSGNFSNSAVESAEKLLIRIYKEEDHNRKHRDVIELKDQLNEETD